MLYAQDRWAVLLMFQAMDAAGKDGTIKHVMSGVNPQGCQVFSFKAPIQRGARSRLPLAHARSACPSAAASASSTAATTRKCWWCGCIPSILAGQKLPPQLVGKKIWDQRYQDIRAFERYLSRNGMLIRKFFLHVSRDEQKKRFLERIDEPEKNWKFSAADVEGARPLGRLHGGLRRR